MAPGARIITDDWSGHAGLTKHGYDHAAIAEMHVEARVLGQPCLHLGMLMSGVVVGDQMNRQVLGRFPMDFLEEGQPFLMPMLFGDGRDQFAFQIVQRREQGQRPVSNVIVGGGLDMTDAQRQTGLGALQRLTLRLLVAAQHQGFLRRVEIQPNDIPEFLLKVCVLRVNELMRHYTRRAFPAGRVLHPAVPRWL